MVNDDVPSGLTVIRSLQILMCVCCQYAVRQAFLLTHFQTKHHFSRVQAQRMLQHSWEILPQETDRVDLSSSVPDLYPELTLYDDGLRCTSAAVMLCLHFTQL